VARVLTVKNPGLIGIRQPSSSI